MASSPSSGSTKWTPPEDNCEKCGAPASWAENWTTNLSWRDSNRFHMALYFAGPRMWPLGYILGSPYSPLHLERQIPNLNWRDRFEDLLALESGEKMISAVSRQKEAATASRIRNETAHEDMSEINQTLQRNQDYIVILQKLREIAVRKKNTAVVSIIDNEALPDQKQSSELAIAHGKVVIDGLEDLQNKSASSYKTRIPWITSLISSGAMLGWESTTYGSADGWQVGIYKADGSGDGHLFTELDLALNFRDGFHFDFRTPTWSTTNGSNNSYHTQIEQYCPDGDIDPDAEHTYSTIEGLRPSMLSQLTTVSRKNSWNGSIETRVLLKNRFTDGKEEEKTIVNDASKVLEEVERFKFSVVERHNAIGLALWELRYRKQKRILDFEMDMEDEGVD